ncbi:hypothetical protein KC19_7G118200 [Ceratodon purpureus]|uniref:HMA domain-containing protein n=1 Tax=Ceratodon purpureus TaxID=3225 RepID=A0A8T0HAI4_CERPU|nr:hypothetical protein KC19_7G118200 [Ceratodon purpureus]
MAGNYFHDPRPFYGLNHHNLISMDELFYGKRDPWYMHQMPYGHYEDQQRSRSVDHRRPEQYIQSHDQYREYRRPDFRDDTYTNFQHEMQHPGKGNQKGGNNHGGNNHSGNNHGGNNHGGGNHGGNNHGGGNHGGNQKKQQKRDSDDEYDDFSSNQKSGNKNKGGHDNNHNHGNKGNSGHGHNQNTNAWSDNRGFHGGHKHHHRRSLSLTQTVLKKLGLRDDSSSDSSDDERYGFKKVNKGHSGGGGHGKSDHKPYTVRFDDQSYGHGHGSNQKHKGVHGLGEDHDSHGSHGKKGGNNHGGNNHGGNNHGGNHGGNNHGGQPQGILKKPKNNNDGYSSDEENRGHKNKGGNQHHGGSESGKKGHGQSGGKLGRSQSMDFRVNLCCENCERKVKKSLKYMDDVDQVLCDQWNNRVVVVGNAKPESVLKKLRKVKKDTHLWQHHK